VSIAFIIALMMETGRTSETSVHCNKTAQCYIPQDYHLHTRHRENMNSQKSTFMISKKKLHMSTGHGWLFPSN
jgi:hypothetical protein